jgi:hypothetical protein
MLQLLEITHTHTCVCVWNFFMLLLSIKKNILSPILMTTYIIDVYLLHIKSQEIDSLEVFVNKFKRKINRKVKVVTSNKNYKYYERYNETG